jgi:hypothetical protein
MENGPLFYCGQTLLNKETEESKVVSAIYYSIEDKCFLYTFEPDDTEPREYFHERLLIPDIKWADIMASNIVYKVYNELDMDYYYDILKVSPFRVMQINFEELNKILLGSYELLRDSILLTKREMKENSDYASIFELLVLEEKDHFYLSELFRVATALPFYIVGLDFKLWDYHDNIEENDLWRKVIESKIIYYPNTIAGEDKISKDLIYHTFYAYFYIFRSNYGSNRKYRYCATLFADITCSYLGIGKTMIHMKELRNKYFDFLEYLEIKINRCM